MAQGLLYPPKRARQQPYGMVGNVVDPRAKLGGLSVIVVGNDALIEALPARPVQFSHACLAAGFDQVVPLSWGDELVAEATLRALDARPGVPIVRCSCPVVRQRLLRSGNELAPLLVSIVSPPVAAARYVRAAFGARLRFLTFVGRCPGARQGGYDAVVTPSELLTFLTERGVDIAAQPDVFDAVLPPDRRRHASLPGGCPTPELLWSRGRERALATVEGEDFGIELAQLLLQRESLLIEPALALGCACSGVTPVTTGRSARIAVMSVEPPRSPTPVLDEHVAEQVVPTLSDPLSDSTSGPATGRASGGITSTAVSHEERAGRAPLAVTPPGALAVGGGARRR